MDALKAQIEKLTQQTASMQAVLRQNLTEFSNKMDRRLSATEEKLTSLEGGGFSIGQDPRARSCYDAAYYGPPPNKPFHTPSIRLTNVDFPLFDGNDVEGWLISAEQFFMVNRTNDAIKLDIAPIHFTGQAIMWYGSYLQQHNHREDMTWEVFKRDILLQFWPSIRPTMQMMNLNQNGSSVVLEHYVVTAPAAFVNSSLVYAANMTETPRSLTRYREFSKKDCPGNASYYQKDGAVSTYWPMSTKEMEVVVPDIKVYSCPEVSESKSVGTFAPLHFQDDHKSLLVDRGVRSPKLAKSSSAANFSIDLNLDSDSKTVMPAAAGAVVIVAIVDEMLGPKEDRHPAIVLTGSPAHGKTFAAAKLTSYLRWLGHDTKQFNVGKYRRLKHGTNKSADFFRADSPKDMESRIEVLSLAMDDMIAWMQEGGHVGIFDATNNTRQRRNRLMLMAARKCKLIFSSIQVNNISGYLPGRIALFLVNTHLTPHPILLTRHGENWDNVRGRIFGVDSGLSDIREIYAKKLSNFVKKRLKSECVTSIWTSTLQRTIITVSPIVGFPKIQWRALDEINAGNVETNKGKVSSSRTTNI